MADRVHNCPCCVCGQPEPLVVNHSAPFYPLVAEIERLSGHLMELGIVDRHGKVPK
jgi:hypothetical protein